MSFVALPDRLSLFQWGNGLKRSLINLTVPIPPKSEKDWQRWANLLISINRLNVTLPSKQMYPKDEDWRKWAWMFIKTYNSTTL